MKLQKELHKNLKITFEVGIILESEKTSVIVTSVVFYITRPNSAFDIEQPVGSFSGISFLVWYHVLNRYLCNATVLYHAYTGVKCRKSYNSKQNIAALLEGTILQEVSEFGQFLAIWRHCWIEVEIGIMKGHTGVTEMEMWILFPCLLQRSFRRCPKCH